MLLPPLPPLLLHAGDPLRHLWARWVWAPGIVAPLALSGALYAAGLRALWARAGAGRPERHRRKGGSGIRRWEAACFAAGWLTLVLALVSPLHPLSEQLFSAHMVQHELLMAVAAPLLVLGRPVIPWLWALPPRWRRAAGGVTRRAPVRRLWRAVTQPAVAWMLHFLAIWLWHAPRLFEAAVASEAVHALQHASFLATALLFWWALVHGGFGTMGSRYGTAVLYLFTTAAHTTALGALLTFSSRVWYPAYQTTAALWGMTPLEDQQLAGLIMWVPASLSYLIAALALLARALRESEARVRLAEGARVRAVET